MIAISVKQPWAYLLCAGAKDIENRTWKCPECGMIQPALIDRSKFWDSFVHECRNCSYMITESDWEEVK